jgi:hypothetical protein
MLINHTGDIWLKPDRMRKWVHGLKPVAMDEELCRVVRGKVSAARTSARLASTARTNFKVVNSYRFRVESCQLPAGTSDR